MGGVGGFAGDGRRGRRLRGRERGDDGRGRLLFELLQPGGEIGVMRRRVMIDALGELFQPGR